MSQVQIRDSNGFPIPDIRIRYSIGDAPSSDAKDDKTTDNAGNLSFPYFAASPNGYTLHINDSDVNERYETKSQKVNSLDAADTLITLERVIKPLQRIQVNGDRLVDENNSEYLWNMSTNFMLPQRVAEGQDIGPLIHRTGGSRIMGITKTMSEQAGLKPFNPDNYPNWLQAIEVCIDVHAERGKRCQLNLFCDMQFLNYPLDRMRNLVDQVDEMLKPKKNVFFSLGNENKNNGFNADDFNKPKYVVSACGSGLTGEGAPLSRNQAWDIQHQHLRRDGKMFIDIPPIEAPTFGATRPDGSRCNILIFDETIGWANFDSNSRTSNKKWAFQLAATARAWNGITIHIHNGGHSDPLNGDEEQSISEYNRGMLFSD